MLLGLGFFQYSNTIKNLLIFHIEICDIIMKLYNFINNHLLAMNIA